MQRKISLYDAKTQLSALVDDAAAGKEFVICKNGVPKAKLVPMPRATHRRKPAGAMKVTFVAEDFDALDPEIAKLFEGA